MVHSKQDEIKFVEGAGIDITGASRRYLDWKDYAGSTTTSYGANSGHQYYTKFQTTWDGTWGMIYSPYYYYGCGINAFCMSLENPRKFININSVKNGFVKIRRASSFVIKHGTICLGVL